MAYKFSKELPVKEQLTPDLLDMLLSAMHGEGCHAEGKEGSDCIHGRWLIDSKALDAVANSGLGISLAIQISLKINPAELAYLVGVGMYIGREIERIYAAGETVDSALEHRKEGYYKTKEQVASLPPEEIARNAKRIIENLTPKKKSRPTPGYPTDSVNFPIQ